MIGFLEWVRGTPLSLTLQTQLWMIPTLQAVHIFTVALVFVSAMVLDLRLLGVMNRGKDVAALSHRFAPWVGWGVAVLALSGLLNMIAEPTRAILNPLFQLKMLALALACAITWVLAARAQGRRLDEPGVSAKALAVLSVLLWAFIVVAGRWVAYTA